MNNSIVAEFSVQPLPASNRGQTQCTQQRTANNPEQPALPKRRKGPTCGTANLALAAVASVVMLMACTVSLAQSGRYYVTDESGFNAVWQFQGGALVSSFPTVPGGNADGPILVDGNTNTVRSVKGGFNGGPGAGSPVAGSEYNFAGVVQGPLSLDFTAHPGYGRVIDAAFDGSNSYIVAGLFGNAGVFRFNADFSGPGTLMFNLLGTEQATSQGITFDTSTGTIWTSDYDFNALTTGGRVRQWSLAGVELFSFPVVDNAGNASERNTALAYDPSDDTFWMNAHVENTLGFGLGELWQFSRTGTFLQKIHAQQTVAGAPSNILYWGGEIFIVPEPTACASAVVGMAALLLRRRHRGECGK